MAIPAVRKRAGHSIGRELEETASDVVAIRELYFRYS
jgi:hypothetical protein